MKQNLFFCSTGEEQEMDTKCGSKSVSSSVTYRVVKIRRVPCSGFIPITAY